MLGDNVLASSDALLDITCLAVLNYSRDGENKRK